MRVIASLAAFCAALSLADPGLDNPHISHCLTFKRRKLCKRTVEYCSWTGSTCVPITSKQCKRITDQVVCNDLKESQADGGGGFIDVNYCQWKMGHVKKNGEVVDKCMPSGANDFVESQCSHYVKQKKCNSEGSDNFGCAWNVADNRCEETDGVACASLDVRSLCESNTSCVWVKSAIQKCQDV